VEVVDVEGETMNRYSGFAKIGLLFGIISIAFLAMVGCVASDADTNDAAIAQEPETAQSAATAAPDDPYADLMDDDPMKGDINAPVTIVEFSDFECPFCERYYSQTYKQIDEQYIKTGKVRYVFRDYPLSFHPDAQKAAEAAQCAGDQGKFWEMHDMIFENQHAMGVGNLKSYAEGMGLDSQLFNQCLDSGKYSQEVLDDQQDGARYGVSGTPTFFINGKIVVGAQPYSVFKEAIDAELG
jgi:protein-disulfide isomerase